MAGGEFLRIAEEVLERERTALSSRAIVDAALRDKLFTDKLSGKTPQQTMNARLSEHILREGANSIFVRTGPGRFLLRRFLQPQQELYFAPRFAPAKASEHVLVFPRKWFQRHSFQGITTSAAKFKRMLLRSGKLTYMPRHLAEHDDNHKQVLSYILVRRQGNLLCFRRGSYNRVADFLRGSLCVGFGGHVSDKDLTLLNAHDHGMFDSAVRELAEELQLPKPDLKAIHGRAFKLVGAINDDSSPVGRRHFAFVYAYDVSTDTGWNQPKRGEKSINQLKWVSTAEQLSLWNFEYWSQLCLRQFARSVIRLQPDYKLVRKGAFKPPVTVCVIGEIGSGKSEATRLLRDDFGFKEVNSGVVLAGLLKIPPVPATPREEFQRRAWEFITRKDGPRRLASALDAAITAYGAKRVVIDGIRQAATLEEFRKLRAGRVATLFVHTSPDLGFRLYRIRSKSSVSVEAYLRARESAVEREVPAMIERADAILFNWTGRALYRKAIRAFASEVGIAK